jgi:hypothetical protein
MPEARVRGVSAWGKGSNVINERTCCIRAIFEGKGQKWDARSMDERGRELRGILNGKCRATGET